MLPVVFRSDDTPAGPPNTWQASEVRYELQLHEKLQKANKEEVRRVLKSLLPTLKQEAKKETDEAKVYAQRRGEWEISLDDARRAAKTSAEKKKATAASAAETAEAPRGSYRKWSLVLGSPSSSSSRSTRWPVLTAPRHDAPPLFVHGKKHLLEMGATLWACEVTDGGDHLGEPAEWLKVKIKVWSGGGTAKKEAKATPDAERAAVGYVIKNRDTGRWVPGSSTGGSSRGRDYQLVESAGKMEASSAAAYEDGDLVQIVRGVASLEIKPGAGKVLVASTSFPEDYARSTTEARVWCVGESCLPLPAVPPRPPTQARKALERMEERVAAIKEEIKDRKPYLVELRSAMMALGDGMEEHEDHWQAEVLGQELPSSIVQQSWPLALAPRDGNGGQAAAAAAAAAAADTADAAAATSPPPAMLLPAAEATATTLALTDADFPLKIFFLDKSGSMGCDAFTKRALGLATVNVMEPDRGRGANLVFFLAAPGETQAFLRRAGDAPVEGFELQLGSATWFNEPVLRTLLLIAPAVEELDAASWSAAHGGAPPVQVVCMTDGQDNASPGLLSELGHLVASVRGIVGPRAARPLFQPVTSLREARAVLSNQRRGEASQRVPVFLCWMLLGCGGRQFLEQDPPRGLAFINLSRVSSDRTTDGEEQGGPLASRASDRRDRHNLPALASPTGVESSQEDIEATAPSAFDALVHPGAGAGGGGAAKESEANEEDDEHRAAGLALSPLCKIGMRVLVKPLVASSRSSGAARGAREAIVVEVDGPSGSVAALYEDEQIEEAVTPHRLLLPIPQAKAAAEARKLPSSHTPQPAPPLLKKKPRAQHSNSNQSVRASPDGAGGLSAAEALKAVNIVTTDLSSFLQLTATKTSASPPTRNKSSGGVTIDLATHPKRQQLFAPPPPPPPPRRRRRLVGRSAVLEEAQEAAPGAQSEEEDGLPPVPVLDRIPCIDASVLEASRECVEAVVKDLEFERPPRGFTLQLMRRLGRVAVRAKMDEEERGLAQILAHAALSGLSQGRCVTVDAGLYQATVDQITALRAAGARNALQWRPSRDQLLDEDGKRQWQRLLVTVAEEAMRVLGGLGVLSAKDDRRGAQVFSAFDPELPALSAALRFLDPVANPHCIGRCMARVQRAQLPPSFTGESSSAAAAAAAPKPRVSFDSADDDDDVDDDRDRDGDIEEGSVSARSRPSSSSTASSGSSGGLPSQSQSLLHHEGFASSSTSKKSKVTWKTTRGEERHSSETPLLLPGLRLP